MEKLIALTIRHKILMDEKNVLICVYRNGSGFLWNLMKADSGTDLGWSDFERGDCPNSGTFTTYEKALEDALDLVSKCDLKTFKKEAPAQKSHWGCYAQWLFSY